MEESRRTSKEVCLGTLGYLLKMALITCRTPDLVMEERRRRSQEECLGTLGYLRLYTNIGCLKDVIDRQKVVLDN